MTNYKPAMTFDVPSRTDTVTGNTGVAVPTGSAHSVRALLGVTAASGTTPSLTVTLQTSADATTWRSVGSFTAATGVTSQPLSFSGLDEHVRWSWVISGTTPSFTWGVSGRIMN